MAPARTEAQRHDVTADWWLDLVLAVLLLGASLSWSTHLLSRPSPLDLGLCLAFLLAGAVFACQATVSLTERARH
ncbi:hypothetical protein [uncultured Nocardioides sp.]|uniref:hypothetical protein n=1 Tax=uncultured Nocardioides sp. TaxID=198441 RepID=UPI00261EEBA0|nr:hypothetical protein [uncultured Nocardioides sp.]